MTLIASLTNGPGTISAQGAKLSASAGNHPHTAMIATLATMGSVHGGNGAEAVTFLLDAFARSELADPYTPWEGTEKLALQAAAEFKKRKDAAQEAGLEYTRIPCLGHPVFRNDPVNRDPREQVIDAFYRESGRTNVFLDFYHGLAQALRDNGVHPQRAGRQRGRRRGLRVAGDLLEAAAGQADDAAAGHRHPLRRLRRGPGGRGAGEFLDHQDFGTEMDMRVPVAECRSLTRAAGNRRDGQAAGRRRASRARRAIDRRYRMGKSLTQKILEQHLVAGGMGARPRDRHPHRPDADAGRHRHHGLPAVRGHGPRAGADRALGQLRRPQHDPGRASRTPTTTATCRRWRPTTAIVFSRPATASATRCTWSGSASPARRCSAPTATRRPAAAWA